MASALDHRKDNSATELIGAIAVNESDDHYQWILQQARAIEKEAQVLHAPELDDLHDAEGDAVALRLSKPSIDVAEGLPNTHRGGRGARRSDPLAGRHRRCGIEGAVVASSGRGLHRERPATTGAGPVRVLATAMVVGAAAAAGYTAFDSADTRPGSTGLLAGHSVLSGGGEQESGAQVVPVPKNDAAVHAEELARGAAFAQERAEREARLQMPQYVSPTRGRFTSGFGTRWGTLHGGIDIANAVGTPVAAVSDGVVIEAGPVSGYGMWVKLGHADGSVTLYGHINSTTVAVGERVMAGQQIATMGNRGNSTGPHLHMEVLPNGADRADPVTWLGRRGVIV
ncbi:MAG: M23 family metallopeptidase [Mycobacterium sp.]